MDTMDTKRALKLHNISNLNQKYEKLGFRERIEEVYNDFAEEGIMVTSSFAATSALLLREFSSVCPSQEIFFIDTGNHFPETITYKTQLTHILGINVQSISASQKDQDAIQRDQTWKHNPDLCCSINKVKPLNTLKQNYTVWASGLMSWQSTHRSSLDIFELKDGILKFHPLLDISLEQHDLYMQLYSLPAHPLLSRGYQSIGCTHCTSPGNGREGRWQGFGKTECGLHLTPKRR